MSKGSKILVAFFVLLTALSVSATYYKTVILQEFDVTGVWIEFYEDETSYVYFVYNNEEYEIEPETTDYNLILMSVADEIGVPVDELETDFVEYLMYSYEEAEYVEYEEEEESEMYEENEEELDTDTAEEVNEPQENTDTNEIDAELFMDETYELEATVE